MIVIVNLEFGRKLLVLVHVLVFALTKNVNTVLAITKRCTLRLKTSLSPLVLNFAVLKIEMQNLALLSLSVDARQILKTHSQKTNRKKTVRFLEKVFVVGLFSKS
jgi:hypothetical protein